MSRVLLVDDSSTMRAIQKRCLNILGVTDAELVEAADGLEALAQFQRQSYDLILCDIYMPGVDGLEVLREVRKVNADLPFLMITTESDVRVMDEARRLGANDYLIKPFPPSVLQEKLERWLWRTRRNDSSYSFDALTQ